MRRFAFALSTAVLMSMFAVAPAEASGDAAGPPCSDITDGGAIWDGTTLTVKMVLANPACAQVTYTAYASTDSAASPFPSTTTYRLDSSGALFFSLPVADPDPLRCSYAYFYATTSLGQHVADRAPDLRYAQVGDGSPDCPSPSKYFY